MGCLKYNDIEYYVPANPSASCGKRVNTLYDCRNDLIDVTSAPQILHITQGNSFLATVRMKLSADRIKSVYLQSSILSSKIYLVLLEDKKENGSVWQLVLSTSMTWGFDVGTSNFTLCADLVDIGNVALYQGIMQVNPGSYDNESGIDATNIKQGILDPRRLPDDLFISLSKYIYITRNERGQFIINMQTSPIPEKIVIEKFTVKPKYVEIGSTLIDLKFEWTTNKTPRTLTLDGINLNTMSTDYTWKDINLSQNRTFILTASDEDESDQKQATVVFTNNLYVGVSSVIGDNVNSSLVTNLTKYLSETKKISFKVVAQEGEYIYFACPVKYGMPRFFVSGFEGGFILERNNLPITNNSGYTEDYQVWRSVHAGLGETYVDVR